METELWILLISLLGIIIAVLMYRVTALIRKENLPHINVEWKTPAAVNILVNKQKMKIDLYYLIEGIFTNNGGRLVSAIELVSGKNGFVYTMRLKKGEPIIEKPYPPLPEFYILSQSLSSFVNKYLSHPERITLNYDKRIELTSNTREITLNIPIEPGKTDRFTLCLVFRDWMKQEVKEENDVLIGFLVRFNNEQTSGLNVAIGGGGPLTKYKREERLKEIKEL